MALPRLDEPMTNGFDAIVLYTAVRSALRQATVSGVLGTVDYVLRMIATREELESSAARLVARGLLEARPGALTATEAGCEAVTAAPSGPTLIDVLNGIAVQFEPASDATQGTWQLTPEEYRAALDEYRRRFAEAAERVDRERATVKERDREPPQP
jgi:hypothetical protein